MYSNESRVKLIQSESERLEQYLNTVPPDAWSQPSACDLWQVRDVVAHLVWVAEFYVDTISRGVRGDASSPEGGPPADGPDVADFGEYLAQRAIARREALGDLLLPTFCARYERFNQLMASVDPEDWDKPCSFWRWRGNVPVQALIFLMMQELAIHAWDICSRLEPSARLSADALPLLMERIPQRRVIWATGFPTRSEIPAVVHYRFELTDVAPNKYDIIVEGGKARMEPAG